VQLVSQKTFYVPLASQAAFRRFAETFLSRVGITEEDVHSMCLTIDMVSRYILQCYLIYAVSFCKIKKMCILYSSLHMCKFKFFSGPGLNVTNTGFDLRDFRQSCQAGSEAGHFFCEPVSGTAGTNPPRAGLKADYYITATDNQSYLLIVRCVDTFFKDYLILTTRPAISQDTHQKALQSIRELGFDDRRVEVMPYQVINNPFSSTYNFCIIHLYFSIKIFQSCLRTDRFISAVNVPNSRRAPVSYGFPPYAENGPFIGGSNDLRGIGRGFGGPFPPGPGFKK